MLHKCHFRSWVVKAFGIVIDALHGEKTHCLEGPVQQNIEKAGKAETGIHAVGCNRVPLMAVSTLKSPDEQTEFPTS